MPWGLTVRHQPGASSAYQQGVSRRTGDAPCRRTGKLPRVSGCEDRSNECWRRPWRGQLRRAVLCDASLWSPMRSVPGAQDLLRLTLF